MAKNKAATRAEKVIMSKIADLGCIVDIEITNQYGQKEQVRCCLPAELHHPRGDMGVAQRADHADVLPLCHKHHRTGGFGVAFHAGKTVWQSIFGTEQELTIKRDELMGIF